MMFVFSCFLCFVILPCLLAVDVKLLEPKTASSLEVAVIIIPGARIYGEAYIPLGLKIQDAFPGRLWVAILTGFLLTTPHSPQLAQGVSHAKQKLNLAGFSGNNVFLAGHSLGGVFVGNYGLNHGSSLKGVMLWASYLTKGHTLKDYPTPVFTISGDLDGLTRITKIVDTFEELEKETRKQSDNMIYTHPVVVMSGINHGHFASGDMPSRVRSHDLPADDTVTYDSAHKTIARHVVDFIIATTGQPDEKQLLALAGLKAAYFDTKQRLQPLSRVKALDLNSQQSSVSTVLAQKTLLGPILSLHTKVHNIEISEKDVALYEPDVKEINETFVYITTYSYIKLPFNPANASLNPHTPEEIQAIMKSKEGVKQLITDSAGGNAIQLSCKDLNMMLYKLAINSSSLEARQRWQNRGSRDIIFLDDVIVNSKFEWTVSSLKLSYGKSNVSLEVGSPTFIYNVSAKNEKEGGTLYCKLMSPYRAMEWIYIDSLKQTLVTEIDTNHVFLQRSEILTFVLFFHLVFVTC